MEINRFKNHCLIKNVCTEELLLRSLFLEGEEGGGGAEAFYLLIYLFVFIYFFNFISKII